MLTHPLLDLGAQTPLQASRLPSLHRGSRLNFSIPMDKLIKIVTSELVLACLDLEKPFKPEVNASAHAVGIILFQGDENK